MRLSSGINFYRTETADVWFKWNEQPCNSHAEGGVGLKVILN